MQSQTFHPSPDFFNKNKRKKGKKKPIPILPPPVKSRKQARKLTTRFHSLSNEIEVLKRNKSKTADEKKAELTRLQKELELMGGRAAYQSASQLSTSFFNTSKWVVSQIINSCYKEEHITQKIKLLEVGAINTYLLSCKWMDVTAIDIRSSHPDIKEIDFFTMKASREYDVVVLSMVLNCVPDPFKRGLMIRLCHAQLKCGGYFFVMLPRRCLEQSRFMSKELFQEILSTAGFETLSTKNTPKVSFFCCKSVQAVPKNEHTNQNTVSLQPKLKNAGTESFSKPKLINQGKKFSNSFAITVGP